MISCEARVKRMVPVLLVSVLTGAFAAVAALAIAILTSAALSPLAGGMLGVAFGVTAENLTGRASPGGGRLLNALLRGSIAGGTAALVVVLLQ
jgi:hypothetical protein